MMEETKMEMMEETNAVSETMEPETDGSGSAKVLGFALAAVAGTVAAGTAVYKKLKTRKEDKKPKVKKRLKWVEVEEETTDKTIEPEETEASDK